MYVFCYLLLALNLRRLGLLSGERWALRVAQLIGATTALTVGVDFLGVPIQGLVFALIVAVVVTELALWLRRGRYPVGWFALAAGLIGAGAVCSALDVTRTWCDPTSWLQGHALWHVLSALCLLAAYFHYRQFEAELG
jgi:uncharacterized membrane protein